MKGQSSVKRLQLLQNTAVRLLTGAGKREHITPNLASLHFRDPVFFQILKWPRSSALTHSPAKVCGPDIDH